MKIVAQPRTRRTKAFTLVEVMIVVALIAILISIAMPQFYHSRSVSRAMAVAADLRQIQMAKQQFAYANNLVAGSPCNDATDLVPAYLNSWPSGPVGSGYTANVIDTNPTLAGHDQDWYLLHCTGTTADASCPL